MKNKPLQSTFSMALIVTISLALSMVFGAFAGNAEAKKKDAILIAYVSAFSGPLAQFTQSIKFIF